MRCRLPLAVLLVPAAVQPLLGQRTERIARGDIPNEFLEVTLPRGVVHIVAATGDDVTWGVTFDRGARGWGWGTAKWRTATSRDRGFTIKIDDLDSTWTRGSQPVVQLAVPRTLKILHVTVDGGGSVDVTGLAGEISVVLDSGSIAGRDLHGPVIFEARHGGVTLDLAGRGNNDGPVDLLARYGTIGLTLDAQPSVSLALATNCGRIELDYTAMNPTPPAIAASDPGPDADCSERPKNLPPIPGVLHLHYTAAVSFGGGATILHAMALQGDIDVSRKRAP